MLTTSESDEELTSVGVGSAVGHRQYARFLVDQQRMELILEGSSVD